MLRKPRKYEILPFSKIVQKLSCRHDIWRISPKMTDALRPITSRKSDFKQVPLEKCTNIDTKLPGLFL